LPDSFYAFDLLLGWSLAAGPADLHHPVLSPAHVPVPVSDRIARAPRNVIESPQSGVARRTANITRWRDREMVELSVASAQPLKEKKFRTSMAIENCGRWPRSWTSISSAANRRRSQRKIDWLLWPAFT